MPKNKTDKLEDRIGSIVKNIVKRKGEWPIEDSSSNRLMSVLKRKATNDFEIDLQKQADDLFLTSKILNKPVQELNLYKRFRTFVSESELSKAMSSVGAATGLEWVPTDFSNQLIEFVELEKKVSKIFRHINMPTDPFKIPGKKSFSTAKLVTSENTAATSTNVGTRNVTLNAVKLMVQVDVSMELEEDSVVEVLPIIREDIGSSLVRGEEDALLNGDDSGTHFDSDTTDAEDTAKAYKGLRKHAVEQSYTTTLTTFDFDTIVGMKKNMGKYGVDPSKLVWIASVLSWSKLLTLRDSKDNNVLITMDKIGPKATVITGQVGSLLGSPLIISDQQREDLNPVGVFDPTSASNTVLMLVRTDGFVIGDRRKLLIESFHDVPKQQDQIVASMRTDFQPRYDITTERIIELGIGIT